MNMKQVYRDELRDLKRRAGEILADLKKADRETQKAIKALQTSLDRRRKGAQKELAKIEKRTAILEGRLS